MPAFFPSGKQCNPRGYGHGPDADATAEGPLEARRKACPVASRLACPVVHCLTWPYSGSGLLLGCIVEVDFARLRRELLVVMVFLEESVSRARREG